jgi:hypothetical protein
MRRHRSDVAAGIGVVSGLDEAANGPPIVAVFRGANRDEEGKSRGREPFNRLRKFSSLWCGGVIRFTCDDGEDD